VRDYLAFVHDVHLIDYIQPNPSQKSVLASLPTHNFIFTNADANHARRVLHVLQIDQYFLDVIDVNRMEPYCKPSPEAFRLAMNAAGESDPARCALIDDLPHTTSAAKVFGMYSLLFGAVANTAEADAAFSDWRSLPALLNGRRQ
jgi:putative hydrolase of the HAD superfamily